MSKESSLVIQLRQVAAFSVVLLAALAWTPAARAQQSADGDGGIAPDADGSAAPSDGSSAGPAAIDDASPPLPDSEVAASIEPAADEGSSAIPAGMGRVQGVVIDAQSGEALIEAQITVVQSGKRVLTDIDGNYRITLRPGTFDLRIFAELRPARRIANVKVDAGKVTRIDVALGAGEEKVAVQEIEVVAAPDIATDAVQIVRRQKAAVVSDGISAQQIARSPDSNASDSIKRVVAATVQDNKYVVIRGLGGRYSATLLNGVNLPSPDPDTPSAPLDLFPAALLANLTIAKTYSPDLPGNFAGGVLMIETRDFPTKFMLKLRLQGSVDSASTFRHAYSYRGGALDVLGHDDGTRALPALVPRDKPLGDGSFTGEQALAQERSFPNDWLLRRHRFVGPNLGMGVIVGDSFQWSGQKLGYLASVTYSHRWIRRRTRLQRVGEREPGGGFAPSTMQLDDDMGMEQPSLGGLATVGYAPSPAHRINLTAFYTHNTENSASRITGVDNTSTVVDRLRFRFLQREMLFAQFVGENSLLPGRLLLGWQGNAAHTTQAEPDTRDLSRARVPDGRFLIGSASGAAERLYANLSDVTGGGGLDLSLLLDGAKIKGGGNALVTSRGYQTRRFHYDVSESVAALPSDQAFAPELIGRSVQVSERTLPTDGYQASRSVFAGYLMVDLVKLDPLRVIAGARYEVARLEVKLRNEADPMAPQTEVSRRTDQDLLPAANVVLAVGKSSNVRAGYSLTVARPHFREIAPALFFDYVRRRAIGGNPNLRETSIHNGDLRWETFLGPTELLAASVFYKHFDKPIERTVEDASDGTNVSFVNADSARAYGLELELRTSLGRLAGALSPVSLAANLSLIHSRVDRQNVNRALQGQSPYVANVDLGYHIDAVGTQIDALYNVFGRRIDEVGTGGNADVYEEPVHRLDLTVSQPLPAGFNVKLSATNLLNQRVAFTQSDVEILGYATGVGLFASVEWTLDEKKSTD